jgi:hypothetical protein
MLPSIEHGFECGDRAFHVVGPKRREEHQRRLEAAGIDVVAAQQSGQLKEARRFSCCRSSHAARGKIENGSVQDSNPRPMLPV